MPDTLTVADIAPGIPLSAAAQALHISLKTLQKRLDKEGIVTEVDPEDRRSRLIAAADFQKLQESGRKSSRIVEALRSTRRAVRDVSQRVRTLEKSVTRLTARLSEFRHQLADGLSLIQGVRDELAQQRDQTKALRDHLDVLEAVVRDAGLDVHRRLPQKVRARQGRAQPETTPSTRRASQDVDDPEEDLVTVS